MISKVVISKVAYATLQLLKYFLKQGRRRREVGREGSRCSRQKVEEDQRGLGRAGEGPELPRPAV